RAADRRRTSIPPTAWTRSVVSLTTKSAATLEDGGSHFPGRLSGGNDSESDTWPGDSLLEFHPRQRGLQRLCRRIIDLGCHAGHHASLAPVAFRRALMRIPPRQSFSTAIPGEYV